MGSLLVVTGPPGAGKSTVAAVIADRLPKSVLVAGDDFFAFLASGMIEPWLPASRQQNTIVANAASAATREFVVGGYDTIYDGVLGPWSLPTFAEGLGADVSHFDYAILLPPVEVCIERVFTRLGHGFTDEPATRKMHHEFTAAMADFPDRHVFTEVRTDPTRTANSIVEAQVAGTLRFDLAGP